MSYTYVESIGYFDQWPKEAFDTLLDILDNIANDDDIDNIEEHSLLEEYPWLLETFKYIDENDDITSLGYSTEYRKDQSIVWEDGTGCSGDEGMLMLIRDVMRYYKLPSKCFASLETKIHDSHEPDQVTYHIYADDYVLSDTSYASLKLVTDTLVFIMKHAHIDYADVECQRVIKENLQFLVNNCDSTRSLITNKLAAEVHTWVTYKDVPDELAEHVITVIENIMQYEQQT